MPIRDEVVDGLIERGVGFQHLDDNRILRKLIRLEERDHHLVFRAGVIRENEGAEISNADDDQDEKNAFLGEGHMAMIPFCQLPIRDFLSDFHHLEFNFMFCIILMDWIEKEFVKIASKISLIRMYA